MKQADLRLVWRKVEESKYQGMDEKVCVKVPGSGNGSGIASRKAAVSEIQEVY
ncbi:MAG: hypothetical protein Q4C59_06205 [Lachnospiraceae bacterium]|nr:hypothetical protein [Lachnospiraceae bacterium]